MSCRSCSIGSEHVAHKPYICIHSRNLTRGCRQGFEARKAAENERGHHRALEPPKGARHDPRHAYDAAIRQREAVDGYEQRAVRPEVIRVLPACTSPRPARNGFPQQQGHSACNLHTAVAVCDKVWQNHQPAC